MLFIDDYSIEEHGNSSAVEVRFNVDGTIYTDSVDVRMVDRIRERGGFFVAILEE